MGPLRKGISNVSKRSEKQKLLKGTSQEKWEAIMKLDAKMCSIPDMHHAQDSKKVNDENMADIVEMNDEEENKESSSLLSE